MDDQQIKELMDKIDQLIKALKDQGKFNYVNIEHADIQGPLVDKLDYNFDKLDVKEVSGALNLGTTFGVKVAEKKKKSGNGGSGSTTQKPKQQNSTSSTTQKNSQSQQQPTSQSSGSTNRKTQTPSQNTESTSQKMRTQETPQSPRSPAPERKSLIQDKQPFQEESNTHNQSVSDVKAGTVIDKKSVDGNEKKPPTRMKNSHVKNQPASIQKKRPKTGNQQGTDNTIPERVKLTFHRRDLQEDEKQIQDNRAVAESPIQKTESMTTYKAKREEPKSNIANIEENKPEKSNQPLDKNIEGNPGDQKTDSSFSSTKKGFTIKLK